MFQEDLDSAAQDLVHKLRVMSIYPLKNDDILIEGIKCLAISSAPLFDAEALVGYKKAKRYRLVDEIQYKSISIFKRNTHMDELARIARTKK